MNWMMKNSAGKPDAMLTVALVAFAVASAKVLLAGVTLGPMAIGPLDGGALAAYLTPTLGAYVARRFTDSKSAPA